MDNPKQLPSNSKLTTQKPEEHRIEKVISGKAGVKKKSGLRKLVGLFIKEDIENVKDYIFTDVVIPAITEAIVSAIKGSTEMIFYGKGRQSSRSSSSLNTDYNSISRRPRPSSRSVFNLDDYYVDTVEDADVVIERLCDCLEHYNEVTVGDFFDAVGVTGNGYTDRYYGWRDLSQMSWYRRGGKYYFNMPRVIELR